MEAHEDLMKLTSKNLKLDQEALPKILKDDQVYLYIYDFSNYFHSKPVPFL